MMTEPCRAELVLRARRGMLTDSGKLALEAHLAECESCCADQQILAGLDEASTVDIRDGTRLERLSAAARAWAAGRNGKTRAGTWRVPQRRVWAAAAAVLLLASAAGAATWWLERSAGRSALPVPPRRGGSVGAATPLSAPAAPAAPPAVALAPGAESRPDEPPRPARTAASVTAASLLRQAGEARRAGQTERALTLYRRLQSEFAGSAEAMLSRVPLGGLLRERGREREALAQFDRYLESSPQGVLVPEALYGRARTLAAVGERPKEQRAWERLLREFPTSAYAPLARRRIAELR
jgi:tetratricopeptide (TPR) repeat protein